MSGISDLYWPDTFVGGKGGSSSDGRMSGDTHQGTPDFGIVYIVLVLYEGSFGELVLAVIWIRVYPWLVSLRRHSNNHHSISL